MKCWVTVHLLILHRLYKEQSWDFLFQEITNLVERTRKMQIRDAFSLGSGEVIRPLVLIDNVEGDLNMINPE